MIQLAITFLIATIAGAAVHSSSFNPLYLQVNVDENRLLTTPGLHNVIRVTDKLLSGSVPEGDAGFLTLQKLGVKTIITVDGAKPEVEKARKYGMRYVHLPIGYDGVPAEQGLRLAKAVRDLPGLIYMHCHHGKHRSPAAAAVVKLCLDETCTVPTAIDLMKHAGTDSRYLGLYASAKEFRRPSSVELDNITSEFPEVASTGGMVQHMVELDKRWEHLKLIQHAGWKTPVKHPDLDPAHAAMMLWEHYVELGRIPEIQKKPAEFLTMLKKAEADARKLENTLRLQIGAGRINAAEMHFQASSVACSRCHSLYRDVPQK